MAVGNITMEEDKLESRVSELEQKHKSDKDRDSRMAAHRFTLMEDVDRLEDVLEAVVTGGVNTRHQLLSLTPFITAYTIVMVSYLSIKSCFHKGWFVLSCPQCSSACFVGSPAFQTADRRPGCPIRSLAILTADY
jgi:hypothetical protein